MAIPSTDDDPMARSEYLLGPIETIVCSHEGLASGHLSLHDITEAYRILSMRIRQLSSPLSPVSGPFPALGPLRENSANVAAALRRDISRARRISAQLTSGDMSSNFAGPSEGSVGWGQTAYNMHRATDFSTQCHYALRLLSEIYRFPTLLSVFSPQDLSSLLGDVIAIMRCPRLPSFNASKTTLLASWIVRTQRLPADVLLPRMEDVVLCLKRLLKTTVRDSRVNVTVLDALNCITNLLTCHRHIFIAHLTCLLPLVFPFFMHPSSEFRHYTAAVLVSFSQTLITHRNLVNQETIEIISLHTHEFLTPETTRHPTSSRKLPPLFDAAVSSKNFGSAGENAPWALTVMANFAVLLGPSLFLYHGPLKLVMNTAQKALRHRPGRDLNPHVWRTFIWSMSQLYTQQSSRADGDMDTVKRCVLVLKQALHGGLGAALIASLLGPTPPNFKSKSTQKWAVSSAVDIVHDMLSSKSQDLRHEASRLLACLTQEAGAPSNVQRETEWTADLLLSGFLFDGSLLRADKCQVEELVCSTRVFSPRCLSQEEILMHWESISSCFTLVVQNCLEDGDTNLTTTAVAVWRSLLLVQGQPIQKDGQLTASAEFALHLSNLLSQFLPKDSGPLSGEAESVEIQLQSLAVSRQLWISVQNIFSQPWLTTVASSFLAATLQRTFYLASHEVLRNWSLLCSTLITVGIPNVLQIISHQDEAQCALEIKRRLWRLVATDCDTSGPGSWQNVVSILIFPICSWSMSGDDLDVWERVFERSFSAAATSTKTANIFDNIASKCPTIGPSFSVNTALRITLVIFRHLNLDEGDPIPARALTYLSMTLTDSYPPETSTVDAVAKLIKVVHHMMASAPISLLESVIFAVQRGLALWIEDKSVSLLEDQYNELLMPLYDLLLTRLESLPLTVASLNTLDPLLTAVFSRIPPPALGPAAFWRFFHTVHARIATPATAYSDELRVCIDACVRTYGGVLPPGIVPLSSSSQSQTQPRIVARVITETPAPTEVGKDVREQDLHVRSIEHEVIPDSQRGISNAAMHASCQARLIFETVQGPLRPVPAILANAQKSPSPPQVVAEDTRESCVAHDSAGSQGKRALRKHHPPQLEDVPAAKRRRPGSAEDRLRTRSAPLTRLSSPAVPGFRSRSIPKATPRQSLVMDCVEVVPLREILRRRREEVEKDKKGNQQQKGGPRYHVASEVTPETPFVPRMARELLERDEIVPETPDAVLRPTPRTPSPTRRGSHPSSGSPTRLLAGKQPRERALMTSTRLAAALYEVQDVFSRPGVSQIPAEELADSARLLDGANRQLRRVLESKKATLT